MNPIVAIALLVLAYTICLLGCALLALSQTRHWRAVLNNRRADPPKVAKIGWLLVFTSLVPCVLRDGWSFAALLWPLIFAVSAMTIAMMLTYRPAALRVLFPFGARAHRNAES